MRILQLFLLFFTLSPALHALARTPIHIFILHSYSQEYPWTKAQHDAFTSTFYANSTDAAIISTEYLDTKRKKYDENYASWFASYIQTKYTDYQPDLIYITDDNALSFGLNHIQTIFNKSPIIFSGVNDYSILNRLDTSLITGVFEKKEVSPNLRFLKQIDSELNEIIVIGDASNTYQAIENEIKNELKSQPDIHATFIADSSIEKMIEKLSQYHKKYVFLTTLGGMKDVNDQILTLESTISQITHAGNNIILSMEDAYLHKGVLGGYVTSGKLQGKTAAKLALEKLNTNQARLQPVITESPNEYIFDYLELKKNLISLPESVLNNSTLLNEPPSFYERNRLFILGLILALVILLIISMFLFLVILSRKNIKIQAAVNTREKLVDKINAHAKLLESEQRKLNQAQSIAHIGNYTWEVNENITTWSDELFHIVGQNPVSFTPSYDNYLNCIHPDDRINFMTLTNKVLEQKGQYSGEYRIARPTGEIRFVLEEGEVLLDDSGNMTSLVGVIHDITERKFSEAEQDRLQRELAQARKMEALGKLTGGIAHDFNNMLAIIIGYTDLAMDRYRDTMDAAMQSYLENIEQASYRARELVSKMMVFSRSKNKDSQALHLDLAVKEIIEMLRSIIPSSIKIDLACENNLPKVMMDSVQLQQILMNLCVNAKDAMNGKGTLRIKLGWHRELDNECIACHKHIQGDWINLSVSDTGSGMTPAIVERIFEPFFTTKGIGEGTGMGMSILHAIVDSHNGHILIDTAVNKGTTFHLLFPPVVEHTENKKPETEHQHIIEHRGHGERILIVDDEQALAGFLAEMLNSYGYQCTFHTRSLDALEHFRNQPAVFDLLITDQTMPELTGIEMITQMRNIQPGLPVILMTGYSEMIDKAKSEKMGINFFMNKPINSTQLLQFVTESLKNKSGKIRLIK